MTWRQGCRVGSKLGQLCWWLFYFMALQNVIRSIHLHFEFGLYCKLVACGRYSVLHAGQPRWATVPKQLSQHKRNQVLYSMLCCWARVCSGLCERNAFWCMMISVYPFTCTLPFGKLRTIWTSEYSGRAGWSGIHKAWLYCQLCHLPQSLRLDTHSTSLQENKSIYSIRIIDNLVLISLFGNMIRAQIWEQLSRLHFPNFLALKLNDLETVLMAK